MEALYKSPTSHLSGTDCSEFTIKSATGNGLVQIITLMQYGGNIDSTGVHMPFLNGILGNMFHNRNKETHPFLLD